MAKDMQRYLFNKLFFPKVAIIDKPGIIINQASSFYGLKKSRKRIIFLFEDDFVNLQKETIKQIGQKESSLLYYKIGKDFVTRHLYTSNYKKPPSFIVTSLMEKMFESFSSAGMSIADNILFDKNKKSLIVYGENNIISRKTKDASLFAGIVSGILSYLMGENIESKILRSDNPKVEKIIANPQIKKIYVPKVNEMEPLKNYDKLNFPRKINTSHNFNLPSFGDLIKFKKVWYKQGKHYFGEDVIIPMEISIPEVYIIHYKKLNRLDILKKALIESGNKKASSIFRNKTHYDNLNDLKKILCAFGFGYPIIKVSGNKISITLICGPITKDGFLFQAFIINGYLNYIFKQNYKIKELKTEIFEHSKIKVLYSF